MENIIVVKNLSKKIKGRIILDNISFEISKNKIVGLVGPNGAGKSTLLKIMTGLYKANIGDIIYDGINLNDDYEKAMNIVGCLIENTDMYKNLSGECNLSIFKSMFKNVDEETIKSIMSIINIEINLGKKFKTYSLGTKQRLGITNALINKPKILILDEPTNGLDPYGIKELRNLLLSLENTTILISSHILSEIEAICDEVLFMDNGKIISKQIINKSSTKKYIEFEVDDYSKAKLILNNYSINEELKVYEDDKTISKINKELVLNNINVYRIVESSNTVENNYFNIIKDKND